MSTCLPDIYRLPRPGWLSIPTMMLFLYSFTACKSVKPYQRAYLNDEAMQTGKREIGKLSSNMHNYREGASGGGTAKSSGGCGCN